MPAGRPTHTAVVLYSTRSQLYNIAQQSCCEGSKQAVLFAFRLVPCHETRRRSSLCHQRMHALQNYSRIIGVRAGQKIEKSTDLECRMIVCIYSAFMYIYEVLRRLRSILSVSLSTAVLSRQSTGPRHLPPIATCPVNINFNNVTADDTTCKIFCPQNISCCVSAVHLYSYI